MKEVKNQEVEEIFLKPESRPTVLWSEEMSSDLSHPALCSGHDRLQRVCVCIHGIGGGCMCVCVCVDGLMLNTVVESFSCGTFSRSSLTEIVLLIIY